MGRLGKAIGDNCLLLPLRRNTTGHGDWWLPAQPFDGGPEPGAAHGRVIVVSGLTEEGEGGRADHGCGEGGVDDAGSMRVAEQAGK